MRIKDLPSTPAVDQNQDYLVVDRGNPAKTYKIKAGDFSIAITAGDLATCTAQAVIATNAAVSASGSESNALAAAVNATAQAATATTKASQASTSQTAAAASATSASGSATAAATSAAQSATARDASIAAWAASMSPAETLPSISKSLHSGAIVKAIIYDTSKDSDGGAWRKRCTDKSWYNEALGFTGAWGGQAANVAAGWAACGSVVGGAYQNTTDGKFYTPLSVSTQTEIFRGNVREFPEQVAVVAESARVVIYDLTQVGCPMWMVFSYHATALNMLATWSSGAISSIAATGGKIAQGHSVYDLAVIDFIADSATRNSTVTSRYNGTISSRNSGLGISQISATALVNRAVNDVALTVLDTAPTDPATGLPVPTIAVATAGGVSVIKDDGTVVNSSQTNPRERIAFIGADLFSSSVNEGGTRYYRNVGSLAASFVGSFYNAASVPSIQSDATTRQIAAKGFGNTLGIQLLKENPATPTKGMVSYITNAYNTGWMPGDIRGAYLADTTAETITASGELVTNGTFTTDTTGWTAVNSGILSAAGALLTVTNDATGANAGLASQTITTVVGKTYMLTSDFTKGTAATGAIFVGTTQANNNLGQQNLTASGKFSIMFVATGTTTYVSALNNTLVANATSQFDNISVKLASPDLSVKNTGLVLNGSLTKTAVASGAGLVAYSGFSASNYLEQPYNANLDFGTGDFCVMGWVNVSSPATGQYLFSRGSGAAGLIAIYIAATWGVICHATGTTTDTAIACAAGLHHVSLVRASGVLAFWVDGVQVWSAANTQNVSNASAILTLGILYTHAVPFLGSMALWRISATAPGADQIAHIYRTELPLFQANAQCAIAGTSTAVTALGYSETTDTLHVGTSWGRSSFRDLLRVDSEATTVGAVTSLSGHLGAILTGGASSGRYYQPAMLLRDELRRRDEARKALGKLPVFFDYTATASQTAFVLPKGYTAKALYKNGTLMREATTGTFWSRSNDGFQETATLSAGASVSDWISIMATRNY